MKKVILFSVLFSLFTACGAFGETEQKQSGLMVDGFELKGVDGQLVHQNAKWHFVLDRKVKGPKGSFIEAGKQISLLHCSGLEKMVADKKKNPASKYRLWGIVTKYKKENFIFCTYFLPFKQVTAAQKSDEMQINEPDDALTIPDEIVKKLDDKKIIRPEQLQKGLKLANDSIIIDRIGYIKMDEGKQYGRFVFDALGRNAKGYSIELLPCQVIELAEKVSSRCADEPRFKITAIVTQFNGKNYMFLQKASRIYSYGNFSR